MGDSDIDIEEIRSFFNAYDKDGSGYIGIVEFIELAKSLNSKVTEEEIKKGFRGIDQNRDGLINFEELLAWWGDR